MNGSVRTRLASGVAVVGASALVVTPPLPQHLQIETELPVALAAQAQPLPPAPAPVPLVAPPQPLALLAEQVNFHVDLIVDWVVTGVQLAGRFPPIAETLVQDIQGGTPLPVAVSRALVGFADVEFDAGRELIGFAEEWADFQIQFLSDLISGLPALISEGPVGQFATAALEMASALVDNVAEFARSVVTTAQNVVHDVLEPPETPVVSATATPDTSGDTSSATGAALRSAAPRSDETSGSEQDSDETTSSASADADGDADGFAEGSNTVNKRTVSALDDVRNGANDSTDTDDAKAGASDRTEQADEPEESDADKPKDGGGSEDATGNHDSAGDKD